MAAKLMLLHVQTGKYPAALPDDPNAIDPFTLKPFGYRVTTEGFELVRHLHKFGSSNPSDLIAIPERFPRGNFRT